MGADIQDKEPKIEKKFSTCLKIIKTGKKKKKTMCPFHWISTEFSGALWSRTVIGNNSEC